MTARRWEWLFDGDEPGLPFFERVRRLREARPAFDQSWAEMYVAQAEGRVEGEEGFRPGPEDGTPPDEYDEDEA